MKNDKLVSVIIPAYNVEKYITVCLDSVIHQTYKNFEIIVIDDGSTDSTYAICKEYYKMHDNFQLVHQDNSGQSVARNRGIELSKGEYILFLDSDDYIIDYALEYLIDTAIKYDLDVIHFDTIGDYRYSKYADIVMSGYQYITESINDKEYDMAIWTNFLKKEFIIKNELYFLENTFFEDQLYTYQIYTKCGRFMKLNNEIYYYRVNPDSTCNTYSMKKLQDSYRILCMMMRYYNGLLVKNKQCEDILSLCLYALLNVWLHVDTESQDNFICSEIKSIPEGYYKCNYSIKIKLYLFIASKDWKYAKILFNFENILRKVIKR